MLIATLIISSLCLILLLAILTVQTYHHQKIKDIEYALSERLLGTKNKLCTSIITRTWGEKEKQHTKYKGVVFAVERSHVDTVYTTDWKSDVDAVRHESNTVKDIFLEELGKNQNNTITETKR